jgi:hypothetical protein
MVYRPKRAMAPYFYEQFDDWFTSYPTYRHLTAVQLASSPYTVGTPAHIRCHVRSSFILLCHDKRRWIFLMRGIVENCKNRPCKECGSIAFPNRGQRSDEPQHFTDPTLLLQHRILGHSLPHLRAYRMGITKGTSKFRRRQRKYYEVNRLACEGRSCACRMSTLCGLARSSILLAVKWTCGQSPNIRCHLIVPHLSTIKLKPKMAAISNDLSTPAH